MLAVATVLVLSTSEPMFAAPGGNGNGHSLGVGFGNGAGIGIGIGVGGTPPGFGVGGTPPGFDNQGPPPGAGGAPLPALGATLLGQILGAAGLAVLWFRRRRKASRDGALVEA